MKRKRTRYSIHATIPARELTPATDEWSVYCDGSGHSVRLRGRRSLPVLARRRDFAGIVVSDLGKIRCPRCDTKLTDIGR